MERNYPKIILSIILPLIVIGFLYMNGYPGDQKIFMTGRVSMKHAYLENKCKKCHEPWKGVTNAACIECHVDDRHYVRNRIDRADAEKLRCFDCHQEHRGRSYDPLAAEYLPPECQEILSPRL